MGLVHWSPNLSVGVEEIDADHAKLIELLTGLAAKAEADSAYEAIRDGLEELMAETERHFRHEEEIMAREDYPELEHHQRVHEALKREMEQFRQSLEASQSVGPEMAEFIKTWLIGHIMESDKHLGGYLEGRAAAQVES